MVKRKTSKGGKVMVSGAMLMEVDTVLQTQVPFSAWIPLGNVGVFCFAWSG